LGRIIGKRCRVNPADPSPSANLVGVARRNKVEDLEDIGFGDKAGNKSFISYQNKFCYLPKGKALESYAFVYRDLNSSA
jgi:hypothetical protein